jgi:DNA-binding NarL/FixJ family response regulator
LRSVSQTPLTEREVQILRLIADGTNNLDIADRLGLSLGTVKGHVRDILDKLQAADRTHAAVIGLKRRLI